MSDPNGETATGIEPVAPRPARWIAAILCVLYGFAKLNGSQFTVLDSELSKPLGQVSGFWLTWYYFGYSTAYGTAIALLQIVGGVLLVAPRTTLLAALMLMPIAVNIVLIDVFFGVDVGGTLAAMVLLACLWITILPYMTRLRRAVVLDHAPALPSIGARLVLVTLIVGAFAFTWWIANYNNRSPTEIDGVWSVIDQSGGSPSTPRWRTMFFERNRAELVVVRAADGTDAAHDFAVENGRVRIWQTWLKRDSVIMDGHLLPDGRLQLDVVPSSGGGTLTLQRATETRRSTH